LEIIGGSVVACSAVHIPIYLKLKAEREKLASDRKQFFEAIQSHAALNAGAGCRLCPNCKRVVHRWELDKNGGVVCYECKLK
jgi:hypothetical protein